MNSLIEVIKISKAFKAKSSAGWNLLRLKRTACQTADYVAFYAKILTVFLPRFSPFFACYPPESFKIIPLTCIRLKFVDTSFHSSQKPPHQIAIFHDQVFQNSLREAQNTVGAGTRHIIG